MHRPHLAHSFILGRPAVENAVSPRGRISASCYAMYPVPMSAEPTPSRMEAFSDGVIAVIITIMVLELKVPREHGPAGFLTVLPTLGVYLLSFTFTGIYWVNHHHLIDRVKRVTPLILWLNLAFLFCLSLLPFFTSYLIDTHLDSFSVAIYIGSLLLTGVAFTTLQSRIGRHLNRSRQFESEEDARLQLAEQRKGILSVAIYVTAIPIAFFFRPVLALLLAAVVTLIWIIPTFGLTHPAVTRSDHS